MNCTLLKEYVVNNCGSCDYDWVLHNEYIFNCLNNAYYECANICGIGTIEVSPIVPITVIVIFLIGLLLLWVFFGIYPKRR